MKVALCIGHSPKDGGAVTTDGKFSEYSFWKIHLPTLKAALEARGHQAVICNRSDAGGTTPSYAAAACNSTGADLAIEFHFNSADSPAASGTETLYWYNSRGGQRAAEWINQRMVEVLGLPNRGIKPVTLESNRAVNYFRKTRMPAVLVEPSFAASNVTDNDRLQTRVSALCEAIADAVDCI